MLGREVGKGIEKGAQRLKDMAIDSVEGDSEGRGHAVNTE